MSGSGSRKSDQGAASGGRFLFRVLGDLAFWTRTDRRQALRVLKLVEAVCRDPFAGIGKPEPLRRDLAGRWSRRVDGEHRLVYRVGANQVYFLSARHHY